VTRFALPEVTGALTSNDSNRTRSGLKLVGAVRFDPSCTLATERRCAVLSRVHTRSSRRKLTRGAL
jgi:hypothetical protein